MDRRRAARMGLAGALAGAVILSGTGPAPANPRTDESASTPARSALAAIYHETRPRLTAARVARSAQVDPVAAAAPTTQDATDQQAAWVSVAPGHGGYFRTPVQGWKSSDFGMRYDPYYHVRQLHTGVDLAAPAGTPIYAAAAGQVVRAGWAGGDGRYTCISHGLYEAQNLSTCYAHQSAILVQVGQWVQRGQLIGRVGTTGATTGAHLHFEVRLDGTPVQPLNWLDACLC